MTNLKTIAALVGERNPLQSIQITKVLQTLTSAELSEANRELNFFVDILGYTESEIVSAYLWFIDTFMEAQIEFKRSGKYPHSTFAEIENYYKDDKMMRNYVVSLAVTLYTLPQHVEIMRFYRHSIMSTAQASTTSRRYLEIGPGHGHLFVTAMEHSDYDYYTAVDIARSSVDTTRAYAEYCLPEKMNWDVLHKDFFDFDSMGGDSMRL